MDRDLANFEHALEMTQQVFGRAAVPIQLPIGKEKSFRGVVDLIEMKALIYTPDGDGRAKIEEIPADMAEAAKTAHETLVEMVAEGDDKLMEEFFAEGTLPVPDLLKGLRGAVLSRRIFPLMVSSSLHNIGSDAILNTLVNVFPDAAARASPAVKASRSSGRSRRASRFRFLCTRRCPIRLPGGSATSR
jgi:elongation factor G